MADDDYKQARADEKAAKARAKALRPWYKKKRFILGLPVVAIIVIVILGLAAGGSDDDTPSVASNVSATGTATGTTAAEVATTAVATSTPAAPSNQKRIGDLLLTVNGAGPYEDSIFPADAGTHYVAVDITAQNMGKSTYAMNVNNFKLKDSAGFANNNALTAGPEPKIGHHDMVPGQEVRGFIVFKVGNGRNPTELQYQSFTGTPGTIPVNLQ